MNWSLVEKKQRVRSKVIHKMNFLFVLSSPLTHIPNIPNKIFDFHSSSTLSQSNPTNNYRISICFVPLNFILTKKRRNTQESRSIISNRPLDKIIIRTIPKRFLSSTSRTFLTFPKYTEGGGGGHGRIRQLSRSAAKCYTCVRGAIKWKKRSAGSLLPGSSCNGRARIG